MKHNCMLWHNPTCQMELCSKDSVNEHEIQGESFMDEEGVERDRDRGGWTGSEATSNSAGRQMAKADVAVTVEAFKLAVCGSTVRNTM